jgi:hypothetical protein
MRRDLKSRLSKAEVLQPAISWADRNAAHRRQSLRACVTLCGVIRERLRKMGLEPQLAVSLRRGEEAAAELGAIPDSADLKAADEMIVVSDFSNEGDPRREFEAEIQKIAERYRSGQHQLDLANASPVELLAFCVSVELEAWE